MTNSSQKAIKDGVTPAAMAALVKLGDGPLLCHAMTPFARGRLALLGLAQKRMLAAPHDGIGGKKVEQLHYEITELGKFYLRDLTPTVR